MTKSDKIFAKVTEAIDKGTVTVADFNALLEATDKSAKEKIYRRTRQDNYEVSTHSMIGRVVPKKTGRNDPPRQGRGHRYASGTPAKERQNAEQRRKMAARISEALLTLITNKGGDPRTILRDNQGIIGDIRSVASALLISPEVITIGESADWLYSIIVAADGLLLAEEATGRRTRPVRLLIERESDGRQEKAIDGHKKKQKKSDENETRTYEVTGPTEQLYSLEQLFKWIEDCGTVGHSGSASVAVDGDGSARLKFKGVTAEFPDVTDSDPELHIGII